MTYKLHARVYHTNPNAHFHVVEKTVWHHAGGGEWSDVDGAHVLTIGGSGTCGSLRFVSDTGENFIITLGVHNDKGWGDIVTDLTNEQTGIVITPQYYGDQYRDRVLQREKQLASYNVNGKYRNFAYHYTATEGNYHKVNIVIG
jgi:hypothetical protein